MLGWLRGRSQRRGLRVPIWPRAAIAIVITIGLGIWGFRELALRPSLSPLESVYRAIKLYTLDLGPAANGGGAPQPNWQLWVALILAALLVLRALVALGRARLRGIAMRRVLNGHVIVCGGGVHGTALVTALAGGRGAGAPREEEHDVVLVDLDPTSPGMQASPAEWEWRLVGDAVAEQTLLDAGVKRAHTIVAVTGNDFVNCQIVSAVRALGKRGRLRDRAHVLVQVEDPGLARFLEEETELSRAAATTPVPVVSPFSANAIAAESLIRESGVRLESGEREELLRMRSGAAPSLLLVGDHPLIDAIVLDLLRRWRVRILREFEQRSASHRPPLRVSLFGPEAVARARRLRRRWQPEPHVLALEAMDSQPSGDGAGEIETWQRKTHDWLRQSHRADHAIVACLDELDGVKRTLELSRVLGDRVLITRVSAQSESVLDEHIEDRLQYTEVKSLAQLACKPEEMARLGGQRRLGDALASPHADPSRARALSAQLFTRSELEIHSDSTWRVRPSEIALLEALLDPVPVSALLRAGLTVNLNAPTNLRRAARTLSEARAQIDAFSAWCEYARALDDDDLPELQAELDSLAGSEPDGPDLAPALLRLRAFTLGDRDALPASASPDVLRDVRRVAIFAGGAASMSETSRGALGPLLERALLGYDGAILSGGTSVGLPGIVGRVASGLGLPTVGYVPTGLGDPQLYRRLRETAGRDFSMREPLAMWEDVLGAGIKAENVRVVVCPGGPITTGEIQLARALGASVAWIDPAGESHRLLDEILPFGADGVLEPPVDAMTIRAFLMWSELAPQLRDPLAAALHTAYRRRQRSRKPADDPALAPWDDLIEPLRASNLAQADDIPNKLALVGRRLAERGERLVLRDEQIEVLAELEHGRFNIERLRAGWELGERRLDRSATPYLKPWAELSEEAKDYDREAIMNIDPALRELGWGVVTP